MQLLTLEMLAGAIEFALVEHDVLHGLEEGNKVLALINKEMDIDKVDCIMQDTKDAIGTLILINLGTFILI